MKTHHLVLILSCSCAAFAADQTAPPVYKTTAPAQPAAEPAPPPAAPPKRSAADLEKLVAPIALYPDPLIATVLPASVYPLEIAQAARFVADTNNLAKLDEQPWDENVRAVARIPEVIKKMNDDLTWTIDLGEAFLAQDKDVMDAIQSMRGKAQKAGTLRTSEQQVVVVTNTIVETTVEQQVVMVTNTIVQIQPSNPQVIYVPTYNPYTVYYPPPGYVYNPYAPLVGFGVGLTVGLIIGNNCDWYHGGCYHSDVDINIDRNVDRNVDRNRDRGQAGTRPSTTGGQKKWQPDQSRLSKSGAPTAANSARTAEARGWNSGGARPSTQPGAATRPAPSTGANAARPSTGNAAARPSTGAGTARPSTGTTPANRPAASPNTSRPSASPSPSQPRSSAPASRPSSSGSAFGGTSSGAGASASSSRGAASRGGGGGGRSGGGGRR
jgi:hypothetical protein